MTLELSYGVVSRECQVCRAGLTKAVDECGRVICVNCRDQYEGKPKELLDAYIDALPPVPSRAKLLELKNSMTWRKPRTRIDARPIHISVKDVPVDSRFLILREGQWKYLLRLLDQALEGSE